MVEAKDDSVNIEVNNSQSQTHLSPNKKSPNKKRPTSPAQRHREDALRHQTSFDERKAMLRANSKIDDDYIDEYNKTEIIRKSIQDVKKRADEEKKHRESGGHAYTGVKSAIAKNMKAQQKGKKMQKSEEKIP